jgi:hypothetical protein
LNKKKQILYPILRQNTYLCGEILLIIHLKNILIIMDKTMLGGAIVVMALLIGIYYMQVPTTTAYMKGAGKMPIVGEQQYSAEYLYKNRPVVATTAAVDSLGR